MHVPGTELMCKNFFRSKEETNIQKQKPGKICSFLLHPFRRTHWKKSIMKDTGSIYFD